MDFYALPCGLFRAHVGAHEGHVQKRRDCLAVEVTRLKARIPSDPCRPYRSDALRAFLIECDRVELRDPFHPSRDCQAFMASVQRRSDSSGSLVFRGIRRTSGFLATAANRVGTL